MNFAWPSLGAGTGGPEWIFAAVFGAAALGFVALAMIGTRAAAGYRVRFATEVGGRLHRAFVFVDSGRLLAMGMLVAVAAALAVTWASASAAAGVITALVCGLVPRLLLGRLRRRREARFRDQIPDLIGLVAGGLRAGNGLAQALAQAAAEIPPPASQELRLLLREQHLGATLERCLIGLETRMPLEETRLLVAALRVAASSGGSVAAALDALAETTRRKIALEGRIRALTAQGRLQALVMGLLPFALAGVLFAIDPVSMGALFRSGIGLAVCLFVLVSQAAGIYLIRRIVAIEV